ncbi:Creatinine amidohydrolase [Desulfosporosinus sp. I2]|uniref:creatininase family protein n=1 Tax=Desulfosporosinus sp. I2 TaxID=1617025 RepID=UPI0005EEAF34|nr:creatininase family protein [Desulfosporosinus sp. I2]KJR48070.1 Creatinine amidohydrolase [Desulfosporosinus sp. I2]
MLLQNLTWTDAKEQAKKNPVVIVPLGATEQHGPLLPLWVDICLANEIAVAVGEQTGAIVTPPLNFGYSELWETYPGTISFSSSTFKSALHDICSSLIRAGFKKIFLLNGHNPNLIIMQTAAYDLVNEFGDQDISIVAATYIFMAKEECDKIGENFRDGTHANEMETSMMLALHPDLVKMERLSEQVESYEPRRVIAFDQGAIIVNKWPESKVYSGVYGNPALATAEKGQAYFEVLVEKISQFTMEFQEGKHDPTLLSGKAKTN